MLREAFPDVQLYSAGSQVVQLYDAELGYGSTANETVDNFIQTFAGVFGVTSNELQPGSAVEDSLYALPLMYDGSSGAYKFTAFYYRQYKDGLPVYGADVRLLVRNEPGFPLVLVNSGLRDLSTYAVPAGATMSVAEGAAHAAAAKFATGLVNFSPSERVVWAGNEGEEVTPAVALLFVADNGMPATGEYQKWRVVADAASGALLHTEDLILHTDVSGNVKGMATTAPKADICNPEVATAMKYAKVALGSTALYADQNGNFTLPYGGSGAVNVTSYMEGLYFIVADQAGPLEEMTLFVTPPGPVYFIHNLANTSELIRAQVNGYVQANVIRDWVLGRVPSYPVIGNQTGFQVNVNLNDVCNAYYDGSSINFYQSGGGCPNTAYSNVVHHEYGHHLVQCGGSGQGAYGEGMSDTVAALIANDSVLGYGFEGNCNAGIRDANNTLQYPCSGEIHYCGQLISGCIWSTRTALHQTNPFTYMQIIATLTLNSIPLHSGDSITPVIYNTFVTLDGGIGGPHYGEITAGFGAHNMAPQQFTLTVVINPVGSGSVTLNPPGGLYPTGSAVQLTAHPATGYHFDHWSGDLNGGANPATISMTGNRNVTAAFGRLGDLDCNGVVNFDDINPFVLALSNPTAYAAAYPNCMVLNADCNLDGAANFDDIDAFVALLAR
jgi:hypothetical protein